MLPTYFRQKVKKYALQLLAFQCVIIVGLITHSYLQSLQSQQQKEDLVDILISQQEPFSNYINNQTDNFIHFTMPKQAWEADRGYEIVEAAKDIRKYTNEIINEIDKQWTSKNKPISSLETIRTMKKHHEFVWKRLEQLNKESEGFSRMFNDNLDEIEYIFEEHPESDRQIMWHYYETTKTDDSRIACITKFVSDLRLIEKKVVVYLFGRMPPTSVPYSRYDVSVLAPNRLQQGDTLTASIFLAEKMPVQGEIMIGNDTIANGRIDLETYEIKVNRLGIHKIEGELITKGSYGEPKIYPFTHEYTVFPK